MNRNYFPGRSVPEEQRFSQDRNPSEVSREIYSVSYSNTSPPEANGHIIEHNSSVIPGDRSSGSGSGVSGGRGSGSGVSGGRNSGSGASGGGGSSSLPPVTGPTVPHVTNSNQESRLISRTTSQSKTQETKTVTKTIVSRETRFVGIDGEPIDNPFNPEPVDNPFNPYGRIESTVGNGAGDYSHYDPNQSSGYPVEYQGDPYPTVEYHNYQDYPLSPPTPTSGLNESPTSGIHGPSLAIPSNMITNGPQGSGYDELDTTIQYGQFNPENNPYGYAGIRSQQQVLMYGSQQGQGYLDKQGQGYLEKQGQGYLDKQPQGYLDNRPSFDDSHLYRSNPAATVPLTTFDGQTSTSGIHGWRNPELHEVIGFLSHPDPIIRANAAAYLQHLCYMDDGKKQKTRTLGGIPPLVSLLTQDLPEIQRNACGALRNLSFGRKNDENKRSIKNAGGIPALVRLLLTQGHNADLVELVTGVLWNLSSCEDLKRPILDEAVSILIQRIIIPASGWDVNNVYCNPLVQVVNGSVVEPGVEPLYWSNQFRNGSGVLRNVSSAGEFARRILRESEGFIESLVIMVRTAIARNDMDNKSIENCVCILRNLSYRCQEVIDPNYDTLPPGSPTTGNNHNQSLSPSSSRAAALMGSVGSKVGDNLSCFGGSKKKEKSKEGGGGSGSVDQHLSQVAQTLSIRANGASASSGALSRQRVSEIRLGCKLLWQGEIVQPYLALLSGCSNPETLEAAAGAIQNLSACYWQASIDIRAAVRKEKGLPILVELLRMEVDRVVCAVATALRNLAMDNRNKELIGKYAMKDLVSKLPNGNPQHDYGTSDDTIAAVLATLNEVISKNADFAKSLLEANGMERLLFITKNKNNKFSPRVFKFASQLLFNMWQHQELREVYKKAGYKETHFVLRSTSLSRNSSSTTPQGNYSNSTLSRPMSTQSATRYEDRTLPRGGGRLLQNAARVSDGVC